MPETKLTREQCLRRAEELGWLAENSPLATAQAELWDRARYWRSLALRARPAETAEAQAS